MADGSMVSHTDFGSRQIGAAFSGDDVPGITNDVNKGAYFGALYLTGTDVYFCSSPAAGAATWIKLT